ncbi:hypothetical protein KFE26_21420 [Shewanella sp. M16]|uniref:hypothetical protein n=1 Tax=Shewanella sp. M16 TaxID=2830837 RepID=UPI001BAFFBCE|nr:hypothetical protein [Shewanella sp. M16]MBS0044830.1 hypothetical protein [Shewanella sp. M16]
MSKEKATEHIQIKLTPTEFKPYGELLAVTGLKSATLFKKILLSREVELAIDKNANVDRKRLVFLANKASNNINQIAKSLHQAHRGGIVNERVYVETLNNLISLEKLFSGALDKC